MNTDQKLLRRLRADAQQIQPTVTVGKNGITDATVEELDRHLKKDKLVKVRLLKSATHGEDMDDQAKSLADATRSVLIETRGGTAVLYRG